jgi:hypothetical protein
VSKANELNAPFQAGRLQFFLPAWQELTSDQFILEMVKGSKIPIEDYSQLPFDENSKNSIRPEQYADMDKEVAKLLKIGVIEQTVRQTGDIVSPVFLVNKPDGSYRMILNLKEFNKSVEYQHFKMDNLTSATQMMKKGCFMASVDLRHAYYSVPVAQEHRKFLKFTWRGQLYQYTCFPNGLCNCPRFFTKLLKPVYATLRAKGHLSTAFIDDCYLQGQSFNDCKSNVNDTVKLFQSLGFVVHEDKSVLTPCQKLKYLGFWLNSKDMTVTLSNDKTEKLKAACHSIRSKSKCTIRELAQVIGQIVAAFPAVLWGPLYFRELERVKSQALKLHKGEFESVISLSIKARAELDWWLANIDQSFFPLEKTKPDVEITTDASTAGWGAVYLAIETGGRWSSHEKSLHINCLELIAIEYALKSFADKLSGKHVKVLTDNICAVTYLRNMGGSRSPESNKIANKIWQWCRSKNIWLTVSHIPGKLNIEADVKSRHFNDNTEWQLNTGTFERVTFTLGMPEIDLFASRLNYQFKPFVSWGPDPLSVAVDAYTLTWSKWFSYAFPPFSQILKVLTKVERDQADMLIIVPHWTTAVWYPVFLRLLTRKPVLLPRGMHQLQLDHSHAPHPLHKKLQLVAACISGKLYKHEAFMDRLVMSCALRGETQHRNSMQRTCPSGNCSVLNGVLIPFERL